MSQTNSDRTVEKLLRQQAALATFGSFAFREPDLQKILTEAARICAASLEVPFCKICRYRAEEHDLLIEAGCGWHLGVIGRVVSQANESSPQGRAYVTGEPVIIRNLSEANNLNLRAFYKEHGIVSTVDVLIPAIDGAAFGVLEIDSPHQHQYDTHDINFLTGFANVLAEAVATSTRTKQIRDLLASKNLLAEELQHRVRNNLQMISSMLESYARTIQEGTDRHGIDLILRRVTTLGQVYNSLLGTGLSETIDVAEYLRELCVQLPEIQAERSGKVEIHFSADSVQVGLDEVAVLGMVLAELVTNCYLHAFQGRDGSVTVQLFRTGPRDATLTIQDNGIGFDVNAYSQRRGILLAKRLMEQIGGALNVRSGEGTLWTLTFKAPADFHAPSDQAA